MRFYKNSKSSNKLKSEEFEKEDTSIQMLLDTNSDEKEIDRFVILELIKVAADSIEPSIKEGYLEDSVNSRFAGIYEKILQSYLDSIIK